MGSAFDLLEDLGELERSLRNSAAVGGGYGTQRARDVAVQIPHGQFTDTVLLGEGGQLLGVGEVKVGFVGYGASLIPGKVVTPSIDHACWLDSDGYSVIN